MNNFLQKIGALAICYTTHLSALSPTEHYLSLFPLEEVKYNLRLDEATFEQKPIFDKAMAAEENGFCGYYSAGIDFRVYQDLIRIVFEEILLCPIPKDFHFLAVPFYPKREMQELDQLAKEYSQKTRKFTPTHKQLLPFHLSLYANHKTLGFCPAKNFALGTNSQSFDDLYWLFDTLGLSRASIDEAFKMAKEVFGSEQRVLLQLFDLSETWGREPFSLIDSYAYPSWPNGCPAKNQALSDFIAQLAPLPSQFFLLLNDKAILNPKAPLKVLRYTKIQPTKLKEYEQKLRDLILSQPIDPKNIENYLLQMNKNWTL
ncbi:MAG: hypothetical protein K0S07_180 [Chlamydiales bacterium]|jgi:hypothetical protein|nr:hypothetical protein [Chlamydiales bacterium]